MKSIAIFPVDPLSATFVGVCAAVAAALCATVLVVLLKTGWAWGLATDVPNHRSMHSRPTPRVGGWGLIPACIVVCVVYAPISRLACAIALGVAAVSQWDDRRGLPARVRFLVQLAGAAILVGFSVTGSPALVLPTVSPLPTLSIWLGPLLVLGLVWSMNLYNFMDGVDGLAGGMAVVGFGGYSVVALCNGHAHASAAELQLALASAAMAGAAVGFLIFNFPPARLFLGDAGSVPTGFLAAAFGLIGWQQGVWPAELPFLLFAPFIADATTTLVKRLICGDRFWEAHREHYYQRMVRMGWGRGAVLAAWYAMMILGAVLAFADAHASASTRIVLTLIWFGVLACCGRCIDRRWADYNRANSSV